MTLNAIKAAFTSLKSDFRDARFPVIAGRLGGEAQVWGERLLELYRTADRAELSRIDALARFWVLRYRGMIEPADLSGAPGGAGFIMAFTAFPYLDMMMDEWELGDLVEGGEGDRFMVRCLFDGADQGAFVIAERAGTGWRFDLMALYRDKVRVFETFIEGQFQGDFEAFLRHYVAEHDLDFDLDQAWRPLAER
jgi:hypothetical protein